MNLGSTVRVVRLLSLALLLAALLGAGAAQAERRVALVIGNGAYQHAPVLRNPGNDAAAMSALLQRLGFAVESGRDLDRSQMEGLIRRFGRSAAGAEVALVFYAGHGLQVDGENWLLPVDARLEDAIDLEYEAVGLNGLLRAVGGASARVLLLDACRDNPLAAQMRMTGGTRSLGRGLARVEAADVGTLIAFATSPGATAADGTGRNSPFTTALLAHLGEPGLEVRQAMTRVRQSVLSATGNRQTPWENASLTGELYLAGLPPAALAPEPAPAAPLAFDERAVELAFWESIKDSGRAAAFEAYLERYPEGSFAALARLRLEDLAPVQEAALPPATATPEVLAAVEIEAMEAPYRVSSSGRVNLRSGPGTEHAQVGTLGPGEAVTVTGKVRGANWYRVASAGGGEAFVFGGLLQEEAAWQAAEAEQRERAQAQASTAPGGTQVAVGTFPSAAPRPGQAFRDCPECPEMVVIPAGSFVMGSPEAERRAAVAEGAREDRVSRESPQVSVTIGRSLVVGKHPVTRGEYATFVRATGRSDPGSCRTFEGGSWGDHSGRGWRNPGFAQDDRHPVVCVSWDDAQAYVGWLSSRTGKGYRLLSESEWEYAARAGTRTARWWGEDANQACAHANVADHAAKRQYANWGNVHACDDGWVHTAPVGSYRANGFGLHDTLGNVWEWTGDCWNESHAGALSDGRARTSGDCGRRVLRGGAWNYLPWFLRAAVRSWDLTGDRNIYAGFRVARTLD